MKLYFNKTSPYARKVRMVVHEKRLADRIQWHETDPWSDPLDLHDATPIGKVPALVTDDGVLVTESIAIAQHLDQVGDGPSLSGGDPADLLARTSLTQGLIDASFTTVLEARRPADLQWRDWTQRQVRAIDRTIPRLVVPPEGRFDLGDVGLAVALAYL
ncbi:MAG: glutathione S-transferase N-terminal domain-containing protein, partial [Rhodospirillales bacterium]|nr:glutathione S-transferase N-terminal domain-containing protein [Rhodospirillales bacterium]